MKHFPAARFRSVTVSFAAGFLFAGGLLPTLPAAAATDLQQACGTNGKRHVQMVDGNHDEYSVAMSGKIDGPMTRDPIGYWAYDQYWEPNVSVTIENTGSTLVTNPWLRREGMPDTRTLQSIVASIVKPGMSDKEKARRIWEFEINNRFHATSQDHEVQDVVKRVNAYGYTLCYDESRDISDLWRAAGLKTRKGYPTGHSLAEVWYDGGWHEMDSDESIISLLRDNETIASEPQIVADHDLMKRTHTYGVLAPDNRMSDEGGAALIYWEGPRSGEQESFTHHTMDFNLRPGESITWAWNPAGRFHASPYPSDPGSHDPQQWNKRWRVAAHAMDGNTVYDPDLANPATLQYLQTESVRQETSGKYGSGLYLQGASGTVDVPIATAYPVVGGRLRVDLARKNLSQDKIAVSISFDEGKTWKQVRTSWDSDFSRMYIDLNPFFPQTDPARYRYILRFTLTSPEADPQVALKGFRLESTLQMAQLAMPEMVLGENKFIYTDDTRGPQQVKITQVWNECDANVTIPSAPILTAPVNQKTDGTRVKFTWKPGSTQTPADYEFVLSEFPDMRWPLSPNFHKLISRTAQQGTYSYETPYIGLLNPDQKYYWHVRARSAEGVWGPWSKTAEFSAVAPAVPVDASAGFDAAQRTVTLHWQRGQSGTTPVRYKIYGSDERGFTAHDHPYLRNDGLAGDKMTQANLLLETIQPITSISLPQNLWRPYYRVVAVDKQGRLSGPSAQAELQHPLIAITELPSAARNRFYQFKVATNASIGDLVSADENGLSYQMKFRYGDNPVFHIAGAPNGLTIDNHGVISGFIGNDMQKKYSVTITVEDKTNGAHDSITLPLTVMEK